LAKRLDRHGIVIISGNLIRFLAVALIKMVGLGELVQPSNNEPQHLTIGRLDRFRCIRSVIGAELHLYQPVRLVVSV